MREAEVGTAPATTSAAALPVESRWFYRGWTVVAGGFICAALAVGGSVYIFGLFVLPVSEAYGLSRADVNNGLILKLVGTAIWAPFIGRLIDRLSARRVMMVGALLYGAGFWAISATSSLWLTSLAILGPVSMGVTAGGTIAANTVASRWFRRRRGRAIGVLAVSTSAGGFVMAPLVAHLIEEFGWRSALTLTGVGVATTIIAAALFLVRDEPRSEDVAPYDEFDDEPSTVGDAATRDGSGEMPDPVADGIDWNFKSLAVDRNFWHLTLGAGFLLASDQAILASQVPYLQDAGVSLTAAATFVSLLTLSAIAGKLLVGFLSDRIDIRLLFGVIVACHVTLLSALIIGPSYWILLLIASTLGVAVGGVYPVWLSLTARVFGARSYGTIMGVMAVVMQPISVIAIRFIGEVRDRTGAYDLGFGTFIVFVIAAHFLVVSISLPRTPVRAARDVSAPRQSA